MIEITDRCPECCIANGWHTSECKTGLASIQPPPCQPPTTDEPAWYKDHDLAVMRQALEKLEEAAPLLESAEICLGDMPPMPSPVSGQQMDQTVGELLTKVIIISDVLKVAINAR